MGLEAVRYLLDVGISFNFKVYADMENWAFAGLNPTIKN